MEEAEAAEAAAEAAGLVRTRAPPTPPMLRRETVAPGRRASPARALTLPLSLTLTKTTRLSNPNPNREPNPHQGDAPLDVLCFPRDAG